MRSASSASNGEPPGRGQDEGTGAAAFTRWRLHSLAPYLPASFRAGGRFRSWRRCLRGSCGRASWGRGGVFAGCGPCSRREGSLRASRTTEVGDHARREREQERDAEDDAWDAAGGVGHGERVVLLLGREARVLVEMGDGAPHGERRKG